MAIVNHRNNTLSQVDIENINYVNRAFIDDLLGNETGIIINCNVGNLSLSGLTASVVLSNDIVINCNVASLALSGNASQVQLGSNINAIPKALNLTGNTASVILSNDIVINCNVGALSLAGNTASIQLGSSINCNIQACR